MIVYILIAVLGLVGFVGICLVSALRRERTNNLLRLKGRSPLDESQWETMWTAILKRIGKVNPMWERMRNLNLNREQNQRDTISALNALYSPPFDAYRALSGHYDINALFGLYSGRSEKE